MAQWEFHIMSVCQHSCLSYSAWRAHLFCFALCVRLWPVRLYQFFAYCIIKGKIWGKTLLNIKCVLWFSLQILSETFLILRTIQRDIIINETNQSSRRIFEKFWNIKFHSNSSNGSRVVPCRQTERQRERTGRHGKLIIAFHNFVDAPKNVIMTKENSSAKHCREGGYEI
jgi:hypothetical protein